MTSRCKPWSQMTIQEMVDQPLGALWREGYESPHYKSHREAHARGERPKMYRGFVVRYGWGYRQIMVAITPEGLAADWETPYIKRIMAGENGKNFRAEIKTSPLPGGTIKNLLQNMKRKRP